jgi:hypothetical protein
MAHGVFYEYSPSPGFSEQLDLEVISPHHVSNLMSGNIFRENYSCRCCHRARKPFSKQLVTSYRQSKDVGAQHLVAARSLNNRIKYTWLEISAVFIANDRHGFQVRSEIV